MIKESKTSGTVKAGDTIAYTVKVINNGNVSVKDIEVTDELTGDKWTVDTLTTGGSKEFEATYEVKDGDIESGKVTNVATATGKTPDGGDVTSDGQTENDVNQSFNLTIHYVDESGNTMAADYVGSYQYKKSFSVKSPEVAGYTPNYTIVSSDENGMPAKNVEVTVTYYKNAAVTPTDNGGGNTTNITNITNNTTIESDDDDDDDDDSTSSGNTSGNTSGNRSSTSSGRSGSSRTSNNNSDSNTAATDNQAQQPQATEIPQTQTPAASGTRAATRRPAPEREAVISLDDDGTPQLVSASDTETPLMNLGLDEHACNILRFLILLAAFGVVIYHTKEMKRHQSRIFELEEKLEDAKKNK